MNNGATMAAMFGWPVVAFCLFLVYPGHRAAVMGMMGGWLFLPQNIGWALPGLPDYSRPTAIFLGVLLGMAVVDGRRVLAARWGVRDLPMLLWCLSSVPSSLTNGLGVYDGLSGALEHLIMFGSPYLVGRCYFCSVDGLRYLARALVVAGLVYLPLFLIELRLGPIFHRLVYGYEHFKWHMIWRLGWYRPPVFLSHGITMGLWLATTCLIATWAWRSRSTERVLGLGVGWAAAALGLCLLLSRALNGYAIFLGCISALSAGVATRSRAVLMALALVPVIYVGSRVTLNWDAAPLVREVSNIDRERGISLGSRIGHEVLLIDHALKQPLFGWGTYNRNRPQVVLDETPEGLRGDRSVTDSLWIIAFGQKGWFGLAAIGGVLLLPVLLVAIRIPPPLWRAPGFGAVVVMSLVVAGSAYDGLFNAMYNPVFYCGAGGVLGLVSPAFGSYASRAAGEARRRADRGNRGHAARGGAGALGGLRGEPIGETRTGVQHE